MRQSPDKHEVFRRLYDAHHRAIQMYCARRLPIGDANEAAAETFTVAWRRIDSVPAGDEARLWLFGVARNVVRNAQRGGRRRGRLVAKAASVSDVAAPPPESIVVRRAEDRMVDVSLAALSASDQEVLRLHAWEGLGTAEIAAVIGASRNAAAMRLNRATKRLAKALEAAGFDATDRPRSEEGGES